MGQMKKLMMEIELCDEIDDQYDNGDMLDIDYKGETRRVQFIKPVHLAKAGAGFMAIHDGKHKTFAMEHCANINKIDECLIDKKETKYENYEGMVAYKEGFWYDKDHNLFPEEDQKRLNNTFKPKADAKADAKAELEKELRELQMENSELQTMIGHLEAQVDRIRTAVNESFEFDD